MLLNVILGLFLIAAIIFFVKIALLWNKKMKWTEDEVRRLTRIVETKIEELLLIKELNI